MLDQETIGHLVKTFHLTITYLKIYPPTSQMVVATFDAFTKAIQPLSEKNNTLTFSELSGKLLIDGTEPENKEIQMIGNNILKLFNQRKIQSITFKTGLTKDELLDFIMGVLRKKREELPDFPHVALDQTVYVATIKGEEAVVKIKDMVNNSGGEIVGLIKSIRESYDLIDELPDGGSKAQAQDRLAQELAKQDPTVLREIFERELPPKIEESGLKSKLLSALSQEKVQGIFGEISKWYDEIRKKEGSDFAAVEQLGKLKNFMQTILHAPAAKEIPRQFFEELIRKGIIEQLPEWFASGTSTPTTVFEAEKLLDKQPGELVEGEIKDSLPQIIDKLCQIDNNELIAKLTEKVLENLGNTAAKIRLPAVQVIYSIFEILQAQNREQLLRFIELPLIETAKNETSVEIHYLIEELLRKRARQNLLLGEHELATRIIDLFRQHVSEEIMPDEKIRGNTKNTIQRLIPEIMEVLIADIKSNNEKKRLGSLQILSKLGESAVEPLIRLIKESDDVRSRRLAALTLKEMGEPARNRFAEELNLGLIADELKNVVEALSELGSAEMTEQLNTLLKFPDPSVKKEIMKCLAKLNTNQSRILIIEQIKDRDASVVSEAVRIIGEHKYSEAVQGLIALLESKIPANLQEEICIMLGNIGNNQAVPTLISKMKKKPMWSWQNTTDIERVRMRAAWALRKFRGSAVESALQSATKDKSSSVSLTAKESLAAIQGKDK